MTRCPSANRRTRLSSRLRAVGVLSLAALLLGAAARESFAQQSLPVPEAPPRGKFESRSPRPSDNHYWDPGHWRRVGGTWVWARGKWLEQPAQGGVYWQPGQWERRAYGWVWLPGAWVPNPGLAPSPSQTPGPVPAAGASSLSQRPPTSSGPIGRPLPSGSRSPSRPSNAPR